MKKNLISAMLKPCIIILIAIFGQVKVFAQDNENISEPPIPIYIVCPYHEDSLKAEFSSSINNNGTALIILSKKYDTLQSQILISSAESTAHFTWLYTLIALLGTMILVLLFISTKIRKELIRMKRIEHQLSLSTEHNAIAQAAQQTAPAQLEIEPNLVTSRTRKGRSKKI